MAVVNRALADRFWSSPGVALGQRLRIAHADETSRPPWAPMGSFDWITIVGVVENTQELGLLDQLVLPTVYQSYPQNPSPFMHVLVRTDGDPATIEMPVVRTFSALDSRMAVGDVQPMDRILPNSLATPRFNSLLLGIFAGLALLLSAIGVYGVTAYTVGRRTREFGIRRALGARGVDMARLVGQDTAVSAAAGATLGIVGALAAGRLLSGLLFGVGATDPRILGGAATLLLLVALTAAFPARRATRVSPLRALKTD